MLTHCSMHFKYFHKHLSAFAPLSFSPSYSFCSRCKRYCFTTFHAKYSTEGTPIARSQIKSPFGRKPWGVRLQTVWQPIYLQPLFRSLACYYQTFYALHVHTINTYIYVCVGPSVAWGAQCNSSCGRMCKISYCFIGLHIPNEFLYMAVITV